MAVRGSTTRITPNPMSGYSTNYGCQGRRPERIMHRGRCRRQETAVYKTEMAPSQFLAGQKSQKTRSNLYSAEDTIVSRCSNLNMAKLSFVLLAISALAGSALAVSGNGHSTR